MEVISILLPVKNEALYLEECLKSIADQTFQNWEAIIVNDHSTDATPAIIQKYIKRDDRFKFYQNQGKELIDALKTGLSKVSGKYITRMDGDDLMLPNRLADMHDVAKQNDHNTIITGFSSYFGDKTISKGYQTYEKWLNSLQSDNSYWKYIYRESVVASPNWLMHTSTLRQIGGYTEIVHPEDYAMALRWYAHGLSIRSTLTRTLLWREHTDRISRNHKGYQQEAFFELKINAFIQNEEINRPLVLWGKNPKSKLTASILKRNKIEFVKVDLSGKIHFSTIQQLTNPLLLIAVYPEKSLRDEMEGYLDSIGMKVGEDYWYL